MTMKNKNKKNTHNIVWIEGINLFSHVGTNWTIDDEILIAVRSVHWLQNSPCDIWCNVFQILDKLLELAEEIDDSKFCMFCKTLPKIIDSLLKLMDLVVVNLTNQLHHLLRQRLVHPCIQLHASSLESTPTRVTGLPPNVGWPSKGYQGQLHSWGTSELGESWRSKGCHRGGPHLWTWPSWVSCEMNLSAEDGTCRLCDGGCWGILGQHERWPVHVL